MDKPIIIPCYFHTDETSDAYDISERLDINVEVDDTDFDVKGVHFYSISYVMPHHLNDSAVIGSNSEVFRSPLTVQEVIELINAQ